MGMDPEELEQLTSILNSIGGMANTIIGAKSESTKYAQAKNLMEQKAVLENVKQYNKDVYTQKTTQAKEEFDLSKTDTLNSIKELQNQGVLHHQIGNLAEQYITEKGQELSADEMESLRNNYLISRSISDDRSENLKEMLTTAGQLQDWNAFLGEHIDEISQLEDYIVKDPYEDILDDSGAVIGGRGGVGIAAGDPSKIDMPDLVAFTRSKKGEDLFGWDPTTETYTKPWKVEAFLSEKKESNVNLKSYGFVTEDGKGKYDIGASLDGITNEELFRADEVKYQEIVDLVAADSPVDNYFKSLVSEKGVTDFNLEWFHKDPQQAAYKNLIPLKLIDFDVGSLSTDLKGDAVQRHMQVTPSLRKIGNNLDILLSTGKMDYTTGSFGPQENAKLDKILGTINEDSQTNDKGKPFLFLSDSGDFVIDDKIFDEVIDTNLWGGRKRTPYETALKETIKSNMIMYKTLQRMQVYDTLLGGTDLPIEGLKELAKFKIEGKELPKSEREKKTFAIYNKWANKDVKDSLNTIPQDTTAIQDSLNTISGQVPPAVTTSAIQDSLGTLSEIDYIRSNPYLDDYEKHSFTHPRTNKYAEKGRQKSVVKSTVKGVRADILEGNISRKDGQDVLKTLENYFPEGELSDSTKVQGWPKTKKLPKDFYKDPDFMFLVNNKDSLNTNNVNTLRNVLKRLQNQGYEIPDSMWP